MQQRQPRLGDIVDDYCPRERRITNHAVVAMIGDEVKQTRCATCDAEHQYKQAKIPPQRRKKEVPGVLYQQVLEGMPRKVGPGLGASGTEPPEEVPVAPPEPLPSPEPVAVMPQPPDASEEPDVPHAPDVPHGPEDGSVHRRLIRATLPRLTDEPPQRREPEFTIRNTQHARHGRFGKNFRGHRPGTPGSGPNGNRVAGPKRHGHGQGDGRPGGGGGRPGPGPGPHGNRGPRPGGHGRGGKKSPR